MAKTSSTARRDFPNAGGSGAGPAAPDDNLSAAVAPRAVEIDHMKYGLIIPKHDPRQIRLGTFICDAAPAVGSWDWRPAVALPPDGWPDWGNTRISDCVDGAMANSIIGWSANGKGRVIPALSNIIGTYEIDTGYDPSAVLPDGTNPTDAGSDPVRLLNRFRQVGISGHQISAFAALDPNPAQLLAAGKYLGPFQVGLSIPRAWEATKIWDASTIGALAGGHMVAIMAGQIMGAPEDYLIGVSWGREVKIMLDAAVRQWLVGFCESSPDFLRANGTDPTGLDLAAMDAEVQKVVNQ